MEMEMGTCIEREREKREIKEKRRAAAKFEILDQEQYNQQQHDKKRI